MIIGIAGTLGSGKGTVVNYLKSKGFTHYSSSDVLKKILKERNIVATRENLSKLANELIKDYEGGVLHFSHQYAKDAKHDNYILEALHRVSEGEYVRKIGGIILGIDADIKIRYERVIKRKDGKKDDVTFSQFIADSEREEEGKTGSGPNIRAVMEMADYTIFNDNNLEKLYEDVDKFLATIND
ncbi:AAA family ATPase [Candidatus Kaiserbacteria bacterium]|nr:AAA family ATPase [Candidatus Kaiserbacteria bacterium]